MASKKTAKKRAKQTGGTLSKSDFIRSMPPDMPAKEVVAKGSEQGLSLSEKYVYNIRSAQRPAGGKRATRPAFATAARRGLRSRGGDLETELRHVIAELGLARARQVFDEVESAFAGR